MKGRELYRPGSNLQNFTQARKKNEDRKEAVQPPKNVCYNHNMVYAAKKHTVVVYVFMYIYMHIYPHI